MILLDDALIFLNLFLVGKNHLLILNLWRELRAELGANAPRLVLIGARGWENENIVDMLERSPPLRDFVSERPPFPMRRWCPA